MSYGGSSVLVNCLALAVLLRVDFENRLVGLGLSSDTVILSEAEGSPSIAVAERSFGFAQDDN